jgi:hydroxymethylpyrimidine/phosphomethylpyrimidine kinase
VKTVLTIAGSDSGGGAGIQADLKVFAAHGLHGTCAVTCVTAQDTQRVREVFVLPGDTVSSQMAAVLDDFDVAAVKSGVLGSADVVVAVAGQVAGQPLPYVLDPVAVTSTGSQLASAQSVQACIRLLFPLATLITPNALEAAALTGMHVRDRDDAERAGRALIAGGARAVLVKGGHLVDDPGTDVLVTGDGVRAYPGELIATKNTHGTGCVLSAAIAARLGLGWPLAEAVAQAKAYTAAAIQAGYCAGSGPGPVDPLWSLREEQSYGILPALPGMEYSG